MKAKRIIILFLLLCIGLLLVPLLFGVWLPDVILKTRSVLAEETTSGGVKLRVVQYWNGSDFYTTELEIVRELGRSERIVLDDDDDKTWNVKMTIDEKAEEASIVLGGGRAMTESWRQHAEN